MNRLGEYIYKIMYFVLFSKYFIISHDYFNFFVYIQISSIFLKILCWLFKIKIKFFNEIFFIILIERCKQLEISVKYLFYFKLISLFITV